MHILPAFREARNETLFDLMRAYPLGLLITHGQDGQGGQGGLVATPLPFLIYADEGQNGTLRAHLARANPHWHALRQAAECLVVFQGAQGYITPSWYATKQETHEVVPTWNYATVHAWGAPRVVEEAAWLRRQLDDLAHARESIRPEPWAIGEAPQEFIAAQMQAIVGIEIPIGRIEGKWKMSQNRPAADRAGVVDGLRNPQDPHGNAALAEQVAERHLR